MCVCVCVCVYSGRERRCSSSAAEFPRLFYALRLLGVYFTSCRARARARLDLRIFALLLLLLLLSLGGMVFLFLFSVYLLRYAHRLLKSIACEYIGMLLIAAGVCNIFGHYYIYILTKAAEFTVARKSAAYIYKRMKLIWSYRTVVRSYSILTRFNIYVCSAWN